MGEITRSLSFYAQICFLMLLLHDDYQSLVPIEPWSIKLNSKTFV